MVWGCVLTDTSSETGPTEDWESTCGVAKKTMARARGRLLLEPHHRSGKNEGHCAGIGLCFRALNILTAQDLEPCSVSSWLLRGDRDCPVRVARTA